MFSWYIIVSFQDTWIFLSGMMKCNCRGKRICAMCTYCILLTYNDIDVLLLQNSWVGAGHICATNLWNCIPFFLVPIFLEIWFNNGVTVFSSNAFLSFWIIVLQNTKFGKTVPFLDLRSILFSSFYDSWKR